MIQLITVKVRHAAVNARRRICFGLAFATGGKRRERCEPAGSVDRTGLGAREPGGGARIVVLWGGEFFLAGQSAGQVRDAARSCRGRQPVTEAADRTVTAGGVLLGAGRVLRVGDGGTARRGRGRAGAGEAKAGDRELRPRVRGWSRANWSSRSSTGTGAAAPRRTISGPGER